MPTLVCFLLGFMIIFSTLQAFSYTTAECLGCHEKGSPKASKQISNREFLDSTHGRLGLSCQDCHSEVKDQNHQKMKGAGAVRCNTCHDQESRPKSLRSFFSSFRLASHGKEDFSRVYDKDNCLGCHQGQGAHGERKPINGQTCYKCHSELGKKAAVLGYIHPKADLKTYPVVFASVVLDEALLAFLGLCGVGLLWTQFRKGRKKE